MLKAAVHVNHDEKPRLPSMFPFLSAQNKSTGNALEVFPTKVVFYVFKREVK